MYVGAYNVIENDGICVYCGQRATTWDHFVPYSVAAALMEVVKVTGRYLLPACRECNQLAGSRVYRTVAQKRRYIQRRLIDRYYALYDLPSWSQDELSELGYNLRTYVEANKQSHEWIRERVQWTSKNNPSYARIAAIRSCNAVPGRSSAREGVGSLITVVNIRAPLMLIDRKEMEAEGKKTRWAKNNEA
jgi:hypothetical protein